MAGIYIISFTKIYKHGGSSGLNGLDKKVRTMNKREAKKIALEYAISQLEDNAWDTFSIEEVEDSENFDKDLACLTKELRALKTSLEKRRDSYKD